MTGTPVQQVKQWYGKNSRMLPMHFKRLTMQASDDEDVIRGKVAINLETDVYLASITFWNKGEVSFVRVNKISKEELVMDDRRLRPSDEIDSLLNGYLAQLIGS